MCTCICMFTCTFKLKFDWLIKPPCYVLRLLTAYIDIFAVKFFWLNENSCLIFCLVSFSFLFYMYNSCFHVLGFGLAVCVPESSHPHSHLHTSQWLGEFHRLTGSWNTPHNGHSTSTKSVYSRIFLFMFGYFVWCRPRLLIRWELGMTRRFVLRWSPLDCGREYYRLIRVSSCILISLNILIAYL